MAQSFDSTLVFLKMAMGRMQALMVPKMMIVFDISHGYLLLTCTRQKLGFMEWNGDGRPQGYVCFPAEK